MNILSSLILGIVEGLTEFLPISSTFHLIMTSRILNLSSSDYLKLFEVVIQSGAILSLVFIYAKMLLTDFKLLKLVIYSFLPTAIVGFLLHDTIKNVFFESSWLMLASFIGVGLIFLFLEKYLTQTPIQLSKTVANLTISQSLIIGFAQAFSVIPGVSRAGSVIVAMMLLGYKRDEAAKYTFLLSLPTILAASSLDLFQGRELLMSLEGGWLILGIGFFAAMASAYVVVKWLIKYLSTHTLEIFGWYRLAVAGLLLLFKVLP
jgi:undecaprenyl-diphosphatase